MEARESSRQEIAKRLRDKYRERNTPGMFVAQDVGTQAYDYLKDLESCLPDGDSMFTVLADLIDPTCHPVPSDGGFFTCSECGEDDGRAYTPIMKLFGRAAIPETTARGVKALIDRKMKSGEISSPWEIFENMMGDTYGKDGKAD